jgi:predicted NUDIX family phosphoesterase
MNQQNKNSASIEAYIKELEQLANSVLKLKRTSIPRRPIIIEFCGSPKSGKTACINSLDLFLRRNNFRTKILNERASVCPVQNKYDPLFNIWTVTSTIAELSEVLSNQSKNYDVVILDRGIFDALCWFKWLIKNNHLDCDNYNSITSFLTMNRWKSAIDLIYVFIADPNVSLDREYANLLTRKTGSIMRSEILLNYKETIVETCKEYGTMFRKIEQYDTSNKPLNNVNYEVTKNILEILYRNTAEKIGYINLSDINNSLPETFYLSEIIKPSMFVNFDIRKDIEINDKKIQPIPILVITNKNRDKVLVVMKRKSISLASAESGKYMIYVGGHIREEDASHLKEPDIRSIIRITLQREVKEETGIDFVPNEQYDPMCIWVRSNDRSKKHMAICYMMEIDFDALNIKIDHNEFYTTYKSMSGKGTELDKIVNVSYKMEEWSQLILQKIFNRKLKEQLDFDIT